MPQTLSLLQSSDGGALGLSNGAGRATNASDLDASMQALMKLHAIEAEHQMALLQSRLAAINSTTFNLLSALQGLHLKANQILQKYDKDPSSKGGLPAPVLDQPLLNDTLRPGEIRTRGMTGYDCLTPLDNRRVILYPCHGGIDQVRE
jgi:hypothetical protein